MPASPRPFILPPRRPNLLDIGGPPPLPELGGIPYAGGVDLTQAGPPPLDPQTTSDLLQGGPPVPLETRQELAINSPSADWMYQPYQPAEQELQLRQPVQGRPARPVGGLRRALTTILPLARDLAASSAAGASSPTFIGGLGAGLQQSEADQQRREKRALGQYFQQQKLEYDRQKLEIEARKAQADIEKAYAEAGEARERTKQIAPKQKSLSEYQTAQAAQATQHAEYYKMYAEEKKRLMAAGMAEKQADLTAAQATNYKFRNQVLEAEIANKTPYRRAELIANQATESAARARKLNAEVEAAPKVMEIRRLMADASYQNSVAALRRSAAMAQQGQIRPGDIIRATNSYTTARARLGAAMAQAYTDEAIKAIQAEIQKLDALYAPLLKQQSAPAGGAGGAGATGPKVGDKQNYQGATYVFDGTQWVRQ